jgi:divalent metal cation (Fe/Co/Zn/Cd) transporter
VHDAALEAMAAGHLRAGVGVSVVSIAWTVAASAVAVVLGLAAGSIVLVAFGMTGVLDAAGSVALVVHFRHALRHEAFSERHERTALRVVTVGLLVVAVVTIVASVERLATGARPDASPVGVATAAISVGVLALLSFRKHQVARRIGSRALHADGWLTATGCLLAVVTVAGTGVTAGLGWWWADAAAAIGVALAAGVVAVVMHRGDAT